MVICSSLIVCSQLQYLYRYYKLPRYCAILVVAKKAVELEELSSVLDHKPFPVPPCPESEGKALQVKDSITYIVAGVCIRDGKVLLMQEAKLSCRGSWYLPAGRMEPGESIEQGCVREVREETGLLVEPVSLVVVEIGGGRWLRFTFFCRPVGGELKGVDKADKESIQAGWFDVKNYTVELNLRAWDIIPLIDRTQKWLLEGNKLHYRPGLIPYKVFIVRLVCIATHGEVSQVLLNKNQGLPLFQVPLSGQIKHHTAEVVRKILQDKKADPKIVGVAGVDHTGGGSDGVCLTLVTNLEVFVPHSAWLSVTDEEMETKLELLTSRAMTLDIYYD